LQQRYFCRLFAGGAGSMTRAAICRPASDALRAEHKLAYLDEMTWRFDNRANPFLFRDTLMKLIGAPVLEYKKLTHAA
jgi:hypothetical protein